MPKTNSSNPVARYLALISPQKLQSTKRIFPPPLSTPNFRYTTPGPPSALNTIKKNLSNPPSILPLPLPPLSYPKVFPSPSTMSTSARRRLLRDFRRLQNDPPSGITGAPLDTNIMLWQAVIFGPDETAWEGEIGARLWRQNCGGFMGFISTSSFSLTHFC